MKMVPLGETDILVSSLCLGTMNWGSQISASDAMGQLHVAMDAGVNFIDTAEFYPINPVKAETIGRAERILGLWLDGKMHRQDVVIATKHAGSGLKHVRKGAPITAAMIPDAVEGSLRRMKTDYIDLYQFHWPSRRHMPPREIWTNERPHWDKDAELQHMADCLGALQDEVDAGRIRAFGLSNESAWGTLQWRAVADTYGGPGSASVQSEYSLLCRSFDSEMAEICLQEQITLLAFAPTARGLLSGNLPIVSNTSGGEQDFAFQAVAKYTEIADACGLSLPQMALAWCLSRPFQSSIIVSPGSVEELQMALAAPDTTLSADVCANIEKVHLQYPVPY